MHLRDPETCPRGHTRYRVIDSRKRRGFRRKMHRCLICKIRWPVYLSIIDPRTVPPEIRERLR